MTSIKVKVLPRFPSSVTVSSPILLSRVGGNYAFSFDQTASNATIPLVSSLNAQNGALALIIQPQGRLTLTSGVAITSSDVTAAATVFYTASQCPISDGTNIIPKVSAQLSMVLDSTNHLAGKNFDVFKINDAGTMRIGTGPTWNSGAVAGSDTARGTGAGSTDLTFLGSTGILVNTNAITIRYSSVATVAVAANQAVYLGTIRTTANGQTEDSQAKRFLWNANQVLRPMRVTDATASWAYGTAVVRQANANTANQLAFVTGISGVMADAAIEITVQNSTATARSINFGIGLDSTTTYTQVTAIASCTNAGFTNNLSRYTGFPGLGFHFLSWNETGAGTDTQTWFGSPFSQLNGFISG